MISKRNDTPEQWRRGFRIFLAISIVALLVIAGARIARADEQACGSDASCRIALRHQQYLDGDYGHAHQTTYPAHFVALAKAGYRDWYIHHGKAKSVAPPTQSEINAWWQDFKANDDCIAYYAAKSRCPANGDSGNQPWMNDVTEFGLVCGGGVAVAALAPAVTPVIMWSGGGLCGWGFVVHWSIWGW